MTSEKGRACKQLLGLCCSPPMQISICQEQVSLPAQQCFLSHTKYLDSFCGLDTSSLCLANPGLPTVVKEELSTLEWLSTASSLLSSSVPLLDEALPITSLSHFCWSISVTGPKCTNFCLGLPAFLFALALRTAKSSLAAAFTVISLGGRVSLGRLKSSSLVRTRNKRIPPSSDPRIKQIKCS